MNRLRTLAAVALTVAAAPAAAPLTASAAQDTTTELRRQPTLQRIDGDTVQVRFVTTGRLDRRASDNRFDATVRLRGAVSGVSAAGRDRGDHIYRALFEVRRGELRDGRRYTVRIRLGDDDVITRTLELRPARRSG